MTRPVAIVTGAARGIGRAIATRLAEDGFDIAGLDVADDAALDSVRAAIEAEGRQAMIRRGDLAEIDSHAEFAADVGKAFGRIDMLVNNAGIGPPSRGDLLDLAPENFDRVIAVNLRGTVFFTQAVAHAMLARRGDAAQSIITVTSVSAELASPERADYCISKAGLSMWVKALALRLADTGIGVFEIRPGIIRTDMTAGVADRYDGLIADGFVPARRWGEPADISAAVSALAGGTLGFATGSVIHADGALAIPRL